MDYNKDLFEFLDKVFPNGMTERDGYAIWTLLHNSDLLKTEEIPDRVGSFRGLGGQIADYLLQKSGFDSDYLTYYCSNYAFDLHNKKDVDLLNSIIKKSELLGYKISRFPTNYQHCPLYKYPKLTFRKCFLNRFNFELRFTNNYIHLYSHFFRYIIIFDWDFNPIKKCPSYN